MNNRFQISTVAHGNSFSVLTYDLQNRSIVRPLCDYSDQLVSNLQLSRLTVYQEAVHLRVFWSYLTSEGLTPSDSSDKLLAEFRDHCVRAAEKSPSHRGDREAVKKTVNAKIARVYEWLLWMKETGQVPAQVVGRQGCAVQTALERSSVSPGGRKGRSEVSQLEAYPTQFKLKTRNSKHGVPSGIPSEQTLDAVHEYLFRTSSSAFLAHRNCLFIDIANDAGFRRGSICSLLTEQFIGKGFVSTKDDKVAIVPLVQKFGYQNTFEIPLHLHERVKEFIKNYWSVFLDSKKIPARLHQDHIFISSRTGRPMTDRAMTARLSKAMRAVGAAKGNAIHIFRAKYTVEEVEAEYRNRVALKLDTTTDSVSGAVSLKLGHRNKESIRAYTARHESAQVAKRRTIEHQERMDDKRRIVELEIELAHLRARFADFLTEQVDERSMDALGESPIAIAAKQDESR